MVRNAIDSAFKIYSKYIQNNSSHHLYSTSRVFPSLSLSLLNYCNKLITGTLASTLISECLFSIWQLHFFLKHKSDHYLFYIKIIQWFPLFSRDKSRVLNIVYKALYH